MVNINKLKGKIVENGSSIEALAEKIGVDRSTLYRKLSNNGETLTIKEVNQICKELQLSVGEAAVIFFGETVA